MPLVSVVIPAYNAENYIAQAVESVLKQTLQDIELIVIDDGSSDGTLQVIERTVGGDSRARIVSRPNRGISETPNEGIDLAESPWVAMLDADDVCRLDRLERQLRHAEAESLNVVGSQIAYFGDRSGQSHLPVSHADIVHQLFVWKNPLANPSLLIDRAWLGSARYPAQHSHAQDYALWLELAARPDARFGNLDEAVVQYRVHAEQNTARNVEQVLSACETALFEALVKLGVYDEASFRAHVAAFRDQPITDEAFQQYSQWLLGLYDKVAAHAGRSGELFEFWRRLFNKSAKPACYKLAIANRLGANPFQNLRYWLKYRF